MHFSFRKGLFALTLLLLGNAMAQDERMKGREISDDNDDRLQWKARQDANGIWTVIWQLLLNGKEPELVHRWVGLDKPGSNAKNYAWKPGWAGESITWETDVKCGAPYFMSFHRMNDILDVFGALTPSGAYDLIQFQKREGKWTLAKWSFYCEPGYFSANSGLDFRAIWLAPGKWKLEAEAGQKDGVPRAVRLLEVTGFYAHGSSERVLRINKE